MNYAKHLTFGKILNITISDGPNKGRYISIVKDYDSELNELYISQPSVANIPTNLNKDEALNIKFMAGTMLCSYNAKVIEFFNDKNNNIIYKITGPTKVEKNDKRKYLRIPTPEIPIIYTTLNTPHIQHKAKLIDLSFGGMNIETTKMHQQKEILNLNLNVMNKNKETIPITSLETEVVWSQKIKDRIFLGLKFRRFKINQETQIRNFIIYLQFSDNWKKHLKKVLGDEANI